MFWRAEISILKRFLWSHCHYVICYYVHSQVTSNWLSRSPNCEALHIVVCSRRLVQPKHALSFTFQNTFHLSSLYSQSNTDMDFFKILWIVISSLMAVCVARPKTLHNQGLCSCTVRNHALPRAIAFNRVTDKNALLKRG